MAFSVQMPALGESVTEGTVTRWLKQEGDQVEVDEPLLEVSTDKVDTEIPSPAAGVLERIVAGEDETVEVGGELAVIGDGDGPAAGPAAAASARPTPQDRATRLRVPRSRRPRPRTRPSPRRAAVPTRPPSRRPTPSPTRGRRRAEAGAGAVAASGTAVTMPELGESVTEGTVTRWLKEVGDEVEVDEPLLEVSTDKVDTEIPSPVAGTCWRSGGEDETVEVGGQLAVDRRRRRRPASRRPRRTRSPGGRAGEAHASPHPAQEPAQAGHRPSAEAAAGGGRAPSATPSRRRRRSPRAADDGRRARREPGAPYVTPLVRKLAAEHGVDLSTVTGTGVGGRIRKQDVLAAAEKAAPRAGAGAGAGGAAPRPRAAAAGARGPPAGAHPGERRARAGHHGEDAAAAPGDRPADDESLRVSAQLTTVQEVDVTRIAQLRARAKAEFERREGVKLTYLPFFAKADRRGAQAVPAAQRLDRRGEQGGHLPRRRAPRPSPWTPRAGCSCR